MSSPLADDLEQLVARTPGLWDDLRGEGLFVTGGTGFFGCWLLESLLGASDRLGLGVRATVLTRDPGRFRSKAPHLADHPSVSLLRGDVKSFEFPSGSFPYVVHAATEVFPVLEDTTPARVAATVLDGTRHVLDLAERGGARRLLFVSSGAVYGPQGPDTGRIEEDDAPPPPGSTAFGYGVAKRLAERLCLERGGRTGLAVVIARCFAFVGPYLPLEGHYAVGNFIRDALGGGPVVVQGDGTPVRSYLYASDLAAWLWTILLRGTPSRPYNVGSEEAVSIGGLARVVARAAGLEGQVRILGSDSPGEPGARYVPSTSRAAAELHLRQTVPLDEAVARTLRWHRGPMIR